MEEFKETAVYNVRHLEKKKKTDGESDREVSQKECCDTLVLVDKQKKKKILTNKQN